MQLHERLNPTRCRERGAALPMALAFLVLFAVLTGLIFTFIHTGMASSASLQSQRNDLYTVNGAIDTAINRIQNNAALGLSGGDAQCGLSNVTENGKSANVTCTPNAGSGTTISTTSAPPFAILTTSPFTQTSPLTWSGNTPPGCVNVPPGELGVVQVQNSKLLRVTGNVYVNSDADSDVWANGCPQTTTAAHIVVTGNVKQRASCHDIDPINDSFGWFCGATSAQADPTPDPGLATHRDGSLGGNADPDLNDPAIANPASWAPLISSPPAVQTVPACPAGNVVKFSPGTYNDASALSTLMNGVACPGRLFWFQPGVYYFDFANGGVNGNHEWRISDSNAKVVAGQPNAVPTGSTPVGPVTVTATGASTSSPGFTGPNDAILIGGNLATTGSFNTSNQQRYLKATGYNMGQQAIPPGSSAPVTQLHIVHGESWDTAGTTGSVTGWTAPTATPAAAAPCTTTIPGGQTSLAFCVSNDARTNNGTGATARFATATTTTRAITLSGAWSGTALPAGATVTGVTASVKHRESTANGTITPSLSGTASGGCTVPSTNLTAATSNTTFATQTVALPTCVNNVLSSLSLQYTASYTCAGGTCPPLNTAKQALLDSIELNVTYSVPGPATPQFGAVQVLVRNAADNGNLCTVNLAPTANGSIADATLPLPAGCLSQDALNNGNFSLRYVVNHATCTTPCQNITSQLDGMELSVTYSAPGRAAWDPNDPNANPTVPGACRHDGDPFWTDGVQFVFGGDSHVNLQSGQVELCDQPSTDHQEIVLYGVKGSAPATQAGWHATTATPAAAAPCTTTVPAGSSLPFCVSSDALTFNTNTATARFAGVIAAATPQVQKITLAGGWTGAALPAGATITGVSATVRHRETGTGGAIALGLDGTAGAGCTITAQTVNAVTSAALGDQSFQLPACVNTNLANLSLGYTASYSCTSACATGASPRQVLLDGVELSITYTVAGGGLSPARGCITQAPYYNPTDHSPAYNGACALFKVESDANGGHFPRVVAFWGTVYAPSAAMDVPVDVLSVPVFGRGVVARMLMLGYQVAANAQVPVTTAPLTGGQPQNRTMTLTGKANGKPTKVVATIEFCDFGCPGVAPPAQQPGGRPAVKVYSWQVTR